MRKRLGVRKASFASADETAEVTGMAIGGVTPFALPGGCRCGWTPRDGAPAIVVGGGSRAAKVVGPSAMLLEIPGAEVVEDLAYPAPEG